MDVTKYEASIRNVGKMNADHVKKKYGAGWKYLSAEQQTNAIGHECLMGAFSSTETQVDIQIARDIYKASIKAADIKEN